MSSSMSAIMDQGKYQMPQVVNRKTNAVDQAIEWAKELTEGIKSDEASLNTATRAAAREIHVPFSRLRSLLQPSRRPKTVDVGLWFGLRHALIAHLRRKAAALQARITYLETLGADEAEIRELRDLAQDFARRVERAAGPSAD